MPDLGMAAIEFEKRAPRRRTVAGRLDRSRIVQSGQLIGINKINYGRRGGAVKW